MSGTSLFWFLIAGNRLIKLSSDTPNVVSVRKMYAWFIKGSFTPLSRALKERALLLKLVNGDAPEL